MNNLWNNLPDFAVFKSLVQPRFAIILIIFDRVMLSLTLKVLLENSH